MNPTARLIFHGGAGSVTGANFLLETGEAKLLIDCGLFQGCHWCEEENYADFPYDPSSIHTLLVTHSHIDHIGRIPKLIRDGFKGRIISTEATRAIAHHLLLDSMELLSRDARDRGRDPLYTEADVEQAMTLWQGVPYRSEIALPDRVSARLLDAGHVLGSAMVELERGGRKILFTGDLGNDNSLLLENTEVVADGTYYVMESVYGDKEHKESDMRRDLLEDIIEDTVKSGGTLLIPAFSMERTQDLMFEVRNLMTEGRVPKVPVYIDSPLASRITKSFLEHPRYFRKEICARIEKGEDIFAFPELRFVATIEESKNIHKEQGPKIIIAGSGMSNGGRVLSHERAYLPDKNSTLLIVGYQAAGSIGRMLLEGMKEIDMHGETIPVRARVKAVYGYSAHRDAPGLLEFVHKSADHLEKVFVVMGEPKSATFLTQRVRDFLGVNAVTPERGESADLDF